MNREKTKQYFWFLFSMMGVVFMWAGIWDGIGNLPYLETWWVSLLLGLVLLALSGTLLKENNLFRGESNPVLDLVHKIHTHPERHLFNFKYFDNYNQRHQLVSGQNLKHIEKNFLIFLENNQEKFVPIHRLTEILHKGKTHWKQ